MFKFLAITSTMLMLSSLACGKSGESIVRFQTVSPSEAVLVQSGSNKKSCSRCGMNLEVFYKTSHAAKTQDKQHQYCSIHCLTEHENSGAKLSDKKVVDVLSLKLIDVKDAHYVVGSEIHGTMSRISKYVFRNAKNAKIFQSKFGGNIMNYEEAKKVSQKDFK